MSENYRTSVEEFFQQTNWGKLIAVKCYCTSPFIDKEIDSEIEEKLNEVVNTDGWQDLMSDSFHDGKSSRAPFGVFKVHKLVNSIRAGGIKSPVHMHRRLGTTRFDFWPSNNKIEVLYDFFPNTEFTLLYHDYDFYRECFADDDVDWYKKFEWKQITNEHDYRKLYTVGDDAELVIGWDYCARLMTEDDIWSKLNPIPKRTWQNVDHDKYKDVESYKNAVHLTVTDRYHRVAMRDVPVRMGDILQVSNSKIEFCGKEFKLYD